MGMKVNKPSQHHHSNDGVTPSEHRARVHFTSGIVVAFVLFALCVMGFVRLAGEVREQETMALDQTLLAAVHDHSSSMLDAFIPIATDVGGIVGVGAATLILLTVFLYRREYVRVVVLAMSVAGASALNLVLKAVFMRQRPDLWAQLVHETGYSFPSGHAMMSAGLGIAVMVILWNSRWRWWGIIASMFYIVFVGFSRIYLGVHYPSDVLAGWFVSGAWVMAVALMVRSRLGHQALQTLGKHLTRK